MPNHVYVCSNCKTPSVEPIVFCAACGASPDAGAREKAACPLPPIAVPAGDHTRLRALAAAQRDSRRQVADFLLDELERARVYRQMPDSTVAMDARVRFRLEGSDRIECRTLVYPDRYLPTGQYLSILSPLGVALLGLKAGDRMPFADLQGLPGGVTVTEVAYSPGAAAATRS